MVMSVRELSFGTLGPTCEYTLLGSDYGLFE